MKNAPRYNRYHAGFLFQLTAAALLLHLTLLLPREATAQQILTNFAVPNYIGTPAVNIVLNKIYLSGGNPSAQPIIVVDGTTFSQSFTVNYGQGAAVDPTNNYYWSAGVYSGTALTCNSANSPVNTSSLGYCPTGVSVDAPHRRVWVSAQCGGGNDPLWAINADTFAVIDGPIGSGGVQGATVVNPVTDRLYLSPSGVSKRINPSTFVVTVNAFGYVLGVNPSANLLYAMTNNNTLQIINGAPDPEVVLANINLPFSFGGPVDVNTSLNHLYIGSSSSNSIVVLNATNGAILYSISLGATVTGVQGLVVDSTRSRVYVVTTGSGGPQLYVIQDTPAPVFRSVTCYGSTGANITGTGVKFASNAVYVCANNNTSSGLIASYGTPVNSFAIPAWNVTWPDSNPSDSFSGISATTNALYLSSGDATRTTDIVGGKEDKGLTLKFPLNGATGGGYGGDIWDVQTPAPPGAFSYGGSEFLNAVAVANELGTNFIYVTGNGQSSGANGGRFFASKLNESGTVLWTVTDGAEQVNYDYSGGEAVTGLNTNMYAAGLLTDTAGRPWPYLRKYTSQGTLAWVRTNNVVGIYYGITSLNNYLYAVGYNGWDTNTSAPLNFLIDKWDINGNLVWSRTYNRSGAQDALLGVVSVNGRIFAAGYTGANGTGVSSMDSVLFEIDPATGNLLSTNLFGGFQTDQAAALDSDGNNLYVAGSTTSYGTGSSQLMLLQYTLGGAALTNVSVAQTASYIAMTSNSTFTASGFYSDGSSGTLNVSNGLFWSSSVPSVATVTTNGVATGVSLGSTWILSACNGFTRSNLLTVVAPPTISTNPVGGTATTGGTASLSVTATGSGLGYQWALNGTNISGATGATLTITNFSSANVGVYTVKVTNAAGSVTSAGISLSTVDIHMFAGVIINGPLGSNYLIQASSNLQSAWQTLTNVTLPTQPYIYIDYSSQSNALQFYRALPQQ